VFERCSKHGALFLDEIGEASVPMQIKLLRVLQEREFTPVGGREEKRFWGRVIAATNRSLADLRQSGRFRDDFYYRLCSDIIHVPTLRERIEVSPGELAELVGLMVKRTIRTKNPELAAYVLAIFERDLPRGYAWPGNVRELEQAVRRVLLTGSYKPDLASAPSLDAEERLVARLRDGNLSAEELLSAYSALLYRRLGSYAAVAERTGLDPRTSRKYVLSAKSG
jgi:transcriptional regulator with PAS, ATPase and Fis domain